MTMAATAAAAAASKGGSQSQSKIIRDGITSIGFSGAGFLTCYHLGVSECLLEQGILMSSTSSSSSSPSSLSASSSQSQQSMVLTGVSGGALCAAGMTVGVSPDDGMDTVLHVASVTNQQGRLDALTPGFSLIDQVEHHFTTSLKRALGGTNNNSCSYDDYDRDLLQECVKDSALRIGFTDRRVFPPFGNNQRAYFYIDEFRTVEDIVAACILSSYIPFVTGPAWGSQESQTSSNHAVKRATERIHDMVECGFVKHGPTGIPVATVIESQLPSSRRRQQQQHDEEGQANNSRLVGSIFPLWQQWQNNNRNDREYFWDGGLVNVFPVVDDSTLIVTPLTARFSPNPYISPISTAVGQQEQQEEDSSWWMQMMPLPPSTIRLSETAELYLNSTNVQTLRYMSLSSDSDVLQRWFAQGYDDARRFVKENNLMTVYKNTRSESSTTRSSNAGSKFAPQ